MPDAPNEPKIDKALADALLDTLDRLRDGINLAIECAMRDIKRITKEEEEP